MNKKMSCVMLTAAFMLCMTACTESKIQTEESGQVSVAAASETLAPDMSISETSVPDTAAADTSTPETSAPDIKPVYNVEQGTEKYRDFVLDNVLHSESEGDIHYNVYIPDDYDGSEPYALFFSLPGYQGLYFQGVGENVRTEAFGFAARDYIPKMIIVAPQLNDWEDTSARQTIALTEYFLDTYNIDRSRVYAEGYSGGGETMSRVMGMKPELYTAYLQCSSQWDGNYDAVVKARVPVYFAIGEADEYYGSEPSQKAYDALHKRYEQEGLSDSEIAQLLVLDIKPSSYFTSQGVTGQHAYGGSLFVRDQRIMGWLFGQEKRG